MMVEKMVESWWKILMRWMFEEGLNWKKKVKFREIQVLNLKIKKEFKYLKEGKKI